MKGKCSSCKTCSAYINAVKQHQKEPNLLMQLEKPTIEKGHTRPACNMGHTGKKEIAGSLATSRLIELNSGKKF
jgi:hypothetical protein